MKRLITGVLTLAILSGGSFALTPNTNEIMTVSAECWNSNNAWRICAESGLNLRMGPGTNYPVIIAIPCGETAQGIRLRDDGWAQVRYGNAVGWIFINNGRYATADYGYLQR